MLLDLPPLQAAEPGLGISTPVSRPLGEAVMVFLTWLGFDHFTRISRRYPAAHTSHAIFFFMSTFVAR